MTKSYRLMIRSSKPSQLDGPGSTESKRNPTPPPGPMRENPALTAKGCRGSCVSGEQSQVSVREVKGTLRGEAEGKGFASD